MQWIIDCLNNFVMSAKYILVRNILQFQRTYIPRSISNFINFIKFQNVSYSTRNKFMKDVE